jgi:hypothetical protein
MLAPVIFISLCSPPLEAPSTLGGCRLKRLSAPINIFSINFLRGIFFPLNFFKPEPDTVHRFSKAPASISPKILWAPTL